MNQSEEIKSADEIYHQMINIMPFQLSDSVKPYILEAMEINANQFKSEWVSVEDRLPENRSYVLAFTTNGGYTSTSEFKHGCFFKGLDRLNFVTHWQPLPSPPKVKQ